MWREFSPEEVEDMKRGNMPGINAPTPKTPNGQPSVADVVTMKSKEWGVSPAEADARISRMRNAPPRDPDAPVEMNPIKLARSIAHQRGISLADAQCVAIKLREDTRLAQAKEDAAIENDRKMRATSAALTAEKIAESHAVVICRSNDADTPPNVLASMVAGRLLREGFADATAQKLAVNAVNECRGLPAAPPRDQYAAERTTAIAMARQPFVRAMAKPGGIAVIGMRLAKDGCPRAAAMQIAAAAIDEVIRHG